MSARSRFFCLLAGKIFAESVHDSMQLLKEFEFFGILATDKSQSRRVSRRTGSVREWVSAAMLVLQSVAIALLCLVFGWRRLSRTALVRAAM